MHEVTQARIDNAKLAVRRRPVLVLALGLGAMIGTSLLVARWLVANERDCTAYAEHAAERRHLNAEERREVARSCGVSVIYGPLPEREQAQAVADELNTRPKRTCAKPGAYVAHWFDNERWAAFCPQM